MAVHALLCLLSLLWIVVPAAGKEVNVTCRPWEECVLPCRFNSDGKGARIMWYKHLVVVSCTRYGDTSWVVGHNSPADKYKGRTDLYSERVLEGNATLVLRNVRPDDEGKYFCVTMIASRTDQSGIVNLNVRAPVEEVTMAFKEDTVLCKAENIYPAPKLTWSVDTSEGVRLLRNKTKIRRTDLGFFDIESSLILMDDCRNCMFTCSIGSDGKNRTSSLKQEDVIQVPLYGEATLLCKFPRVTPRNYNLTWRLTPSDPILSMHVWGQRSRVELEVWDRWKAHITDSTPQGALRLKDLTADQWGTYTCEVRMAEETYITKMDVEVFPDNKRDYIIAIAVLACFLGLSYVALTYLGYNKHRKGNLHKQDSTSTEHTEVSTEDQPPDIFDALQEKVLEGLINKKREIKDLPCTFNQNGDSSVKEKLMQHKTLN